MKDHQLRELVNQLTETARTYADTQQLREQIADKVKAALVEPAGSSLNSPSREAFEVIYAKAWSEGTGDVHTAAEVAELRQGAIYPAKFGYLNGWWDAYQTLVPCEGVELTDAQADQVLRAMVPGGSQVHAWFGGSTKPKAVANMRDVIRIIVAEAKRIA